jgi:hypothetical protein
MTKRLGLLIPLLLSIFGCSLGSEPLLPELQGRWSAPNAVKLRYAFSAERFPSSPVLPPKGDCREGYIQFEKRSVTHYKNGQSSPVLMIENVKRDGARISIAGSAPLVAGGTRTQIDLMLRDGEIRFEDIIDDQGHSIRHQRIEVEQVRARGVTTIGDMFRLVFDLVPCRA